VHRHRTIDDCWMAIHGVVYDITSFLPNHPGGKAILLKNAGKDASEAFDAVHPVEVLEEYLRPGQIMGT
ncbi:cytochrome b5-like heme/steroid binding domain-containing protein, partial [Colletotrichum lupini]